MIIRLSAPPLAAWSSSRSLSSASRAHHLDVHSAGAQAYLAQLAHLQDAAAAEVRAAIPSAEVEAGKRLMPDLVPIMKSEDVQEGLRAFMERRPGTFSGR